MGAGRQLGDERAKRVGMALEALEHEGEGREHGLRRGLRLLGGQAVSPREVGDRLAALRGVQNVVERHGSNPPSPPRRLARAAVVP